MSDVLKIQQRKIVLAAERASHIKSLEEIDQEIKELAIAERVISRLSGRADNTAPKPSEGQSDNDDSSSSLSGKPSGLPSVRNMIKEALVNAREQSNLKGLRPKEITDFIRKKHWADVPANQVYTNLSRMANDTRELLKDDDLGIYMLPLSNETSVGNPD